MALFGKLFKKETAAPVETKDPSEYESNPPVVLKQQKFNLNDTLRDVANILAQEAQAKRISIIFRVNKNVPSQVIGDRYKLAAVLNEIIGNAIDFTDKREDVVVQISRNEKNGESLELHFVVRDRGVGITEEAVEEILMPMLTSDKPAEAFGIEGGGLERARDIIHAMKGSLRMRCAPKEGCTVFFHVQLSASDLKEKRHYRLPSKAGVGLKTLVVDDDMGSAKALVPMLEYFRHEVTIGEKKDLRRFKEFDLVMFSSYFWSEDLHAMFGNRAENRPKIVLIESMLKHHKVEDEALNFVDWLIYKPFTQQFVFEMLSALYTDALSSSPESEEAMAPSESRARKAAEGVETVSPRVEAFLSGSAIEQSTPMGKEGLCICCKYSHQFFVAADGLAHCRNDYAEFVEELKEIIWKYVKADRIIANMLQKGELGEIAEYCKTMKMRLAPLGIYKMACLADLLEDACRHSRTKDMEQLSNALGFVQTQTLSSLDQFIEQSKYKIKG